MQILEAGLKEPLREKIVGDQLDTLLITGAKSLPRHLINAFTELSDSERDGRDVLKHLPTDGVDNIKQRNEHLLVKGPFSLRLCRLFLLLLLLNSRL